MKIIEVGNLHDGSTATNIPELISAWREMAERDYDPESVTNPECATMKIQFESIRATLRQCADDLERVASLPTLADMNEPTMR